MKARRHQGTKAPRAFSLVEMLFAIFILGLGVISIASLFPVGLTQQQRSADAIIGPTVANNALDVIRSKVSADDFGWFDPNGNIWDYNNGEIFGTDDRYPSGSGFGPGLEGDWSWRRPAFYLQDTSEGDPFNQIPGYSANVSEGSINLFEGSNIGTSNANTLTEVPYNTYKYFDPNTSTSTPPRIIITQEERMFPQRSTEMYINNGRVDAPQYLWDCAFRRFQGRIQVAIFVYRAHATGGEAPTFRVTDFQNRPAGPDPVLPHFNILDGSSGSADSVWFPDADGDNNITAFDSFVPGTDVGDSLDLNSFDDGWQAPGTWMLDQWNTIHRVMSGRRNIDDGPVHLLRPLQELNFKRSVYPAHWDEGAAVWELWYIPPVVVDQNEIEWRLTPVYVAVREL